MSDLSHFSKSWMYNGYIKKIFKTQPAVLFPHRFYTINSDILLHTVYVSAKAVIIFVKRTEYSQKCVRDHRRISFPYYAMHFYIFFHPQTLHHFYLYADQTAFISITDFQLNILAI